MDIGSGIAGLLGALIGAFAGIITTYINVKSSAKTQLKLEELKRENINKDLHRENLVTVQEFLQEFYRLYTEEMLYNFENILDGKINYIIKKGLEPRILELNQQITFYQERLVNDELRDVIYNFKRELNNIPYKDTFKQSHSQFRLLSENDYPEMMKKIGEEIRKTY